MATPPEKPIIAPQLNLTRVVKRKNVAQQPTIPIVMKQTDEVEQLPTLLVPVQHEVAQQPIMPMAVIQQDDVAQQLTAQMPVQPGEGAQQATKESVVERQEEAGQEPTSATLVQQEIAQQVTAPIAAEQQKEVGEQPTLVQLEVARPPTRVITKEQAKLAEQPTLAMLIKQHPLSQRMWRWFVPVLMCFVLLGGTLVGIAALHIHTHIFSALHKLLVPVNHPRITKSAVAQANDIAGQFMDEMMHKNWAAIWPMLHPDAQASWQDEKDFIHFESAKFGSLNFVTYKATQASIQQPWLDPDTTQVYPNAAILRISLVASAPKGLLSDPSNLALDRGLFNNTLFTMTRVNGVWKILVAGPADLEAPIIVPATPPAVKLLVPIFMYHHISNKPTHNALDYSLTVTTTDFDQQLTWLQQHGFHSIDQTELFDALYYGKALPPHPVILTFDDGYEDAFTDALPALQAHHFRGVFYIITGMIGGNYMTWGQVHTLYQDGMQISSHTVHHVNVGQPPAPDTTQEELTVSQQTLEALLGQPVQFFCYPSGEPFHHDTVAEQQIVLKDLFEDGYVSATLDPFSIFSVIQDAQMPYQLNRLRVSGGEPLNAFIGILNFTLQQGARQLQA